MNSTHFSWRCESMSVGAGLKRGLTGGNTGASEGGGPEWARGEAEGG